MGNTDSGANRETSKHQNASSLEQFNAANFESNDLMRPVGSDGNGTANFCFPIGSECLAPDPMAETTPNGLLLKIEAFVVLILSCLWKNLLAGFAAYGECMFGCYVHDDEPESWGEQDLDKLLNVDEHR